jgi:methionyl-tRNA formyltransferase
MTRKILFLGQKPIGEKCFEIILNQQCDELKICGAVSNNTDNKWWKSARIYEQSKKHNIPFISNEARNNEQILDLILKEEIDTIILVQHEWILPKSIIEAVNGAAFNLHMAKLPEYKGCNTFSYAIINGEKDYYTTILFMTEDVDAGDIVIEESVSVASDETAWSLYKKVSDLSLICFDRFVSLLKTNEPIPAKPMVGESRFYSRNDLEKVKNITDFSDLEKVGRIVRACTFSGFEPAYFSCGGIKYYISPNART